MTHEDRWMRQYLTYQKHVGNSLEPKEQTDLDRLQKQYDDEKQKRQEKKNAAKTHAYIKDEIAYGFVLLDENGEYRTNDRETEVLAETIGAVYEDKAEATSDDVNNKPHKTKLGWWAHWERYELPVNFTVIGRNRIPKRIADEIDEIVCDIIHEEEEEQRLEETFRAEREASPI